MNTFRVVIIGLLATSVFYEWVTLPLLIILVFLIGAAEVVFDSTIQAIVPSIVEAKKLEGANGNLRAAEMICNDILGRPIGGFLILLGLSVPFVVDAITALISVLLLFYLSGSYKVTHINNRLNFRQDVSEGVRWLWHHPLLRGLALLSIGTNIMYAGLLAIQVFFIQEILGLDSRGFGILISTAVVGGVLGTQSVAWIKQMLGLRRAMLLSILGMGIALGLVGLSSHWLVVGMLYMLTSYFVVIVSITGLTLRQILIPNQLLGRVNGVFRLLSWGVSPIGMLFAGGLVQVATDIIGRNFALRVPYIFTGIVYTALFFAARPLLHAVETNQTQSSLSDSSFGEEATK